MASQNLTNAALLLPEELAMPMGMGYVAAAARLGLIYLADTVAMAHMLSRFAEPAIQLKADHDSGLFNAVQFDKALDEIIDRLASILRGENPRYMATPWFTDPEELSRSILEIHGPAYSDDGEFYARLRSDPIREEALLFVTTAIEIEGDSFEHLALDEFIRGYVREILGIPDEMPLPFFEVKLTPSKSISVVRRSTERTD